jgi:CubicO group peptidase (beta-lactamase class C family)
VKVNSRGVDSAFCWRLARRCKVAWSQPGGPLTFAASKCRVRPNVHAAARLARRPLGGQGEAIVGCSLMESFGPWMRVFLSGFLVLLCAACLGNGSRDPASLVAELDAEIPAVVASGNSPSIQVAVVRGDQVVWSQAFGQNTSVNHVYMNASIQKMFTAVAVLQLVERGLVGLDADVQRYVPFTVRHPGFPETPITVRMLLAHRSGLGDFPHQFAWDTESAFSPQYRPPCPSHLLAMSHEEFLAASLTPGGSNYDQQIWVFEPGQEYRYSVSAYPLLRYLVGQVAGQSYAEYMHANILDPLGMTNSGFSADEFAGRHAIPYTRIDGENIELPIWNGRGSMMHTTAEDMAKFVCALLNDGRYGDFQLLQPETIELMQQSTSRFKVFFESSDDLPRKGHGLGLFIFRGGWFGFGGSAPGYQSLLRFHPSRQVGYVILSNVNGILGNNYDSARSDIYAVQDALVSILDPMLVIRYRAGEVSVFAAAGLVWAYFMRKRPRIVAGAGAVWIVCGSAWMFAGAPVGLGLLLVGIISLAWGGINLLKARQSSLKTGQAR